MYPTVGCTVARLSVLPSRFVAPVRPHQRCAAAEEVQIDGFGQVLPQQFDIVAVLRTRPGRQIERGTKDPALTGIWRALLSPVQQAPMHIDSDADTVVAFDVRLLVTNPRHHQWA